MIPPEKPPSPVIRLAAVVCAIGFAGIATLILCSPWTRISLSSSGAPPSFGGALATAMVPGIVFSFLLWFASRADCPWHRKQMRSAIKWAMASGAIGFLIGFAAPLFTPSKKMLGPVLAFYVTGPLGIPIGLALRSVLPFLFQTNIPTYVPAPQIEPTPWIPRCKLALASAGFVYLGNILLECFSFRHSPQELAPLQLIAVPFLTIPNAALAFVAAWGFDAVRDLRSPTPQSGPLHNRVAMVIGLLAFSRFLTLGVSDLSLLRDAHRLPLMAAEDLDQYLKTHPQPDHFRLALAADNPNASPQSLETLAKAPRNKLLAPRTHYLPVLGRSEEARKGNPTIHLLLRNPNLAEPTRKTLSRLNRTSPR